MRHWTKVAVFLAIAGLGIILAGEAFSQSVCGKHADIVKRLSSGYEEYRSSAGIAANGNLVEVFASKKGNWTIIFTKPGGMTCLMAVGENWKVIKNPFKLEGDML